MTRAALLVIAVLLLGCIPEENHGFKNGDAVLVGEYPGVVMRVADHIHDRNYIAVEYICPGGEKVDWVHYTLIKKR